MTRCAHGCARVRARVGARLPAALLTAGMVALAAGCGVLPSAPGPGTPVGDARPDDLASATAPAANAATVLDIEAPAPLRDLLQRHLDLARLAALSAEDAPDEAEWLRLVAAAPAQARELLQTEGYFSAAVQVRREGPAPGGPPSRPWTCRS